MRKGVAYAIGGANVSFDHKFTALDSTQHLDTSTLNWVSDPHLPKPRAYMASVVVQGILLYMGQYVGSNYVGLSVAITTCMKQQRTRVPRNYLPVRRN